MLFQGVILTGVGTADPAPATSNGSSDPSSNGSSLSVATAAGIAVGGLCFVLLAILSTYLVKTRILTKRSTRGGAADGKPCHSQNTKPLDGFDSVRDEEAAAEKGNGQAGVAGGVQSKAGDIEPCSTLVGP